MKKRTLTLFLALIFIAMLSLSIFAGADYEDTRTGKAYAYEVETIDVNTRYPFDAVIYEPVGYEPTVGLIFYAGVPVDYRDYGTLLRGIASAGYLVISTEFPLDMATTNIIAGEEYMKQYPQIQTWFLSGHSHGGLAASMEAEHNGDLFRGLILFDSQMAVPVLKENYPVLAFHATNDWACPWYMYQIVCSAMWMTDLNKIVIEGGNHAQFGDYGVQSNDGPATISKERQLEIAIQGVLDFILKYK